MTKENVTVEFTPVETLVLQPTPEHIAVAGERLRAGGLVAFPTETVYGLGGNALDGGASKRIYAAKGRPSDNPLIVHVARIEDFYPLVRDFPKTAQKLAETFLPGPLTMVLPKSDAVPYATTGGLDTVAVRLPSHPVARALIAAAGVPVAAPSANLSGRPSPTRIEHVVADLQGRVDVILGQGDAAVGGLESTIVDLTGDVPVLLRPGFITLEQLRDTLGEVWVDATTESLTPPTEKQPPRAPGMKYRHYAPRAPLTLYAGDPARVANAIQAAVDAARRENLRTGVLCAAERAALYTADVVLPLGDAANPEQLAESLFAALRTLDQQGVERAFSEAFFGDGVYRAVMNRLVKAAGYNLINVV